MKKIVLLLGLFCCYLGFSQDSHVKGSVLDSAYNDQPLAFAQVMVKGLDVKVETDLSGSYELHLFKGKYTLIYDFIGYESVVIENVQVSDLDINLDPVRMKVKEVIENNTDVSEGK